MRIIGCDKRSIPSQTRGRFDFKVVLVQSEHGDVAAYRGDGVDQWVAINGDKMTFAEAKGHFPYLERELEGMGAKYRDD